MCAPFLVPLLAIGATAAIGSSLMKGMNQTPSTPNIEVYQPEAAPMATQGPEAPTATPIMTAQGQGSAEDEQKSATDRKVRQNKKGRSMLRIDRTTPNTSGLGSGSGVNVPV